MKMEITHWLSSLLLYAALLDSPACSFPTPPICADYTNRTLQADWGFNKFMPKSQVGNIEQYTSLECCGENYDSLTWTFNGKPLFTNYSKIGKPRYEIDSTYGNQSLKIYRVALADEGNYTCIMRRGSEIMSQSVFLVVAPSSDYIGPAQMTVRPTDVTATLGTTVIFGCEGWYGSRTQPILVGKKVEWTSRVDFGSFVWIRNGSRYHERKTYRDNRLYMGSYLTVTNVQEVDYNTEFRCMVMNFIGSPQIQNVRILRPVHQAEKRNGLTVVAASLVGVSLLILVLLLVILVWIKRVVLLKYYYRKRYHKSGKDGIAH